MSTSLDGAKFVPVSYDSKLSKVDRVPNANPDAFRSYALVQSGPKVSATYVSIDKTCPRSCPFRGNGCFAETGFTRVSGRKLDLQAIGRSGNDVARAEAQLIEDSFPRGVPQDGARGGRDLRLHVGGDVPGAEGAWRLANAARTWRQNGGGRVWTYTHRWATVPRERFGEISALASVETKDQARQAWQRGYAPAVTVARFPRGAKVFDLGPDARRPWFKLQLIPCPAEVSPGRVTCASCRLCMDDGALRRRGLGIAFAAHGPVEKVGRALAALKEAA